MEATLFIIGVVGFIIYKIATDVIPEMRIMGEVERMIKENAKEPLGSDRKSNEQK